MQIWRCIPAEDSQLSANMQRYQANTGRRKCMLLLILLIVGLIIVLIYKPRSAPAPPLPSLPRPSDISISEPNPYPYLTPSSTLDPWHIPNSGPRPDPYSDMRLNPPPPKLEDDTAAQPSRGPGPYPWPSPQGGEPELEVEIASGDQAGWF